MQSPFSAFEEAPQIREANGKEQDQLSEMMQSQPTLFFSLLYELYNRKNTTKDGHPTQRLSRVISSGALQDLEEEDNDDDKENAPFTWSTVISSLQDLAGAVFVNKDHVEPVLLIGEGGFAQVYKSLWKQDGSEEEQVVALKQLKNTVYDPEDLEELIGEANLLRTLDHEHIVKFHGIGAMNTNSLENMRDSLFILQEFVGGGTLKEVINKQHKQKQQRRPSKHYTFQDAFRWLLQIAEAIAYLHAQKPIVMHRDLKPENILLTSSDPHVADVKLVDFGLHRRIKNILPLYKTQSQTPMSTGTIVSDQGSDCEVEKLKARSFLEDSAKKSGGHRLLEAFLSADLEEKLQEIDNGSESSEETIQRKPGRAGSHLYMSPETIKGEPYTEKVDVYAFGVLAYELLRGSLNVKRLEKEAQLEGWSSDEALARYARRVSRGWRETFKRTWPIEVIEFIESCWNHDPELRPTMEQVVEYIRSLQKDNIIRQMDKKSGRFSVWLENLCLF